MPYPDTLAPSRDRHPYSILSSLPGLGKRGAMLMTDGEWNCGAKGDYGYGPALEALTVRLVEPLLASSCVKLERELRSSAAMAVHPATSDAACRSTSPP